MILSGEVNRPEDDSGCSRYLVEGVKLAFLETVAGKYSRDQLLSRHPTQMRVGQRIPEYLDDQFEIFPWTKIPSPQHLEHNLILKASDEVLVSEDPTSDQAQNSIVVRNGLQPARKTALDEPIEKDLPDIRIVNREPESPALARAEALVLDSFGEVVRGDTQQGLLNEERLLTSCRILFADIDLDEPVACKNATDEVSLKEAPRCLFDLLCEFFDFIW